MVSPATRRPRPRHQEAQSRERWGSGGTRSEAVRGAVVRLTPLRFLMKNNTQRGAARAPGAGVAGRAKSG